MRYDDASRGCDMWQRKPHAMHATARIQLTSLRRTPRSQVQPRIDFLLTIKLNTTEKPILEAAKPSVSASWLP